MGATLRSVPLALATALALGSLGGLVRAEVTEIGMPMSSWAVSLDLQGFIVKSDEVGRDWRSRKVFLEHKDGRQRLTVVIKPAQAGATASSIRDERRREIADKPHVSRFENSEGSGYAGFRYVNETPFEGKPLHHRSVHRFWVNDTTRIEVHASVGPSFTPAEDEQIHALLDGVRAPSPSRPASFTDEAHGFSLDLPQGWTYYAGGPSGLELRGEGEAIALQFQESRPHHWTLPLLMQAQETAIRAAVIDAPAVRTTAAVGWGGPVEVRVYPQVGGESGVFPFAGVAVLERGGVTLVGLLRRESSANAVTRILASVRPILQPPVQSAIPAGP